MYFQKWKNKYICSSYRILPSMYFRLHEYLQKFQKFTFLFCVPNCRSAFKNNGQSQNKHF